jgi:hypothetical protein
MGSLVPYDASSGSDGTGSIRMRPDAIKLPSDGVCELGHEDCDHGQWLTPNHYGGYDDPAERSSHSDARPGWVSYDFGREYKFEPPKAEWTYGERRNRSRYFDSGPNFNVDDLIGQTFRTKVEYDDGGPYVNYRGKKTRIVFHRDVANSMGHTVDDVQSMFGRADDVQREGGS